MTFKDLNLAESLLQTLTAIGYSTPTEIQQKAIPHLIQGKDIFGCAQTGTGKTAAFALPILQHLSGKRHQGIRALVLAPTRELASQISENIAAYSKHTHITHTTIFGGVSQKNQEQALRKQVDILVATPGRLLDLLQQGVISLKTVEYFVLDEADRMLDMGFIRDIKKIIATLPVKKQTMFFSATVSPEIKELSNKILVNPIYVSVTPVSSAAPLIEQSLFYVDQQDKRSLLLHLLKQEGIENALVFTRTKRGANKVAKDLNKVGIKTEAIHGNKSQSARERALHDFKNKSLRVLVATDLASRGIDIDKLSHVINYEIPDVPETYVHRIGRTGRAGATGIAYSFCANDEKSNIKSIQKLIQKSIPVVSNHPYANAKLIIQNS
jgi:ATP-dependent RNA helicase RhlE